MKGRTIMLLGFSHVSIAMLGFAAGLYFLPILIAPSAPDDSAVEDAARSSVYFGEFSRERIDSDALHWGEGTVSINSEAVLFAGKLAPGPDYKLYLSPEFVETEDAFNALKSTMALVGDVKTFNNFMVALPKDLDPADYTTVIVWCETFGQFITSAQYASR